MNAPASPRTPIRFKDYMEKLAHLIEHYLWAKILLGMILGLLLGLVVSPKAGFIQTLGLGENTLAPFLSWLAFPGQLFLKTIQMVVVPLILASVIKGLASSRDMEQMKRLGLRFVVFALIASFSAAAIAVLVSLWLKPGEGLTATFAGQVSLAEAAFSQARLTPDLLLTLIPANPLSALSEGQMLDVVVIAIVGGLALLTLEEEKANVLLDLLDVVQSISMKVITWAMKLAPYAVFGMMVQVSASSGLDSLRSVGAYVLTAYLGYGLMILAYALLAGLMTPFSIVAFLKKIKTPMLLAFSTSSSAATLPVTMKTAETELAVAPSTAGFIIPLGTTMNMAGSVIWQTSAVLFLARVYGLDLAWSQIFLLIGLSVASTIGSPGVPGVGIGILSMILSRLGVPLEGVTLLIGVERIVDMGCTVVNVTGDLTASAVLAAREDKNAEAINTPAYSGK